MPGIYTTGFKENGVDIGSVSLNLVEKSYLMDMYPGLINQQKAPGLWLWGSGGNGKLGDNATTDKSSPVQTVAAGANWKQVSCGSATTAGIKTDGTLWTWGYFYLGDNTAVPKSSPVQTIAGGTNWKQVSVGNGHTAAIKTDGTLWLWGTNTYGTIGDNTTTTKSSPVQTVTVGTNWKQVSAGELHTAAIKTDGTLWMWGNNNNGSLGDNTTTSKSSPVQTIAGGTNWKQVSAGVRYTLAIKTDGTLWGWGGNAYGQLGDGTLVPKSSPVQTVAGGTNWKQASANHPSAYLSSTKSFSGAIKTDGTLWMWGFNEYGQLGDGTLVPKSSPVQTVAGGTNWKQIDVGGNHAAAIKADGTMWLWGYNGYGQLGNNSLSNRSSPVQNVTGGNNWKQVSCGKVYTAAIREGEDW